MAAISVQCRRCRPTYERTAAHRANMSAALTGRPKPHLRGRKRPDVGAKIAAAWTEEMREAARARGRLFAASRDWLVKIAESLTGEKNPRWRGGISGRSYAAGFSKALKRSIRERDDFTCQLCGATEAELGCALSIHHADYDKSNHDDNNLHSTCKACNSRVNSNRDVWIGYFVALSDMRRKLGKDVNKLIGRKVIAQREGFVIVDHT
jgi:hypothetical protein